MTSSSLELEEDEELDEEEDDVDLKDFMETLSWIITDPRLGCDLWVFIDP